MQFICMNLRKDSQEVLFLVLGADILLHCLEAHDVDVVFGLPGGVVIPLYDRLKHFPNIKHILTRHEQGAAHAADGYARATGKVGVCLPHPVQGQPTWLPGSQLQIWIPFLWFALWGRL